MRSLEFSPSDDYIFYDRNLREITAAYKVIGNAVPCKLAYAIGKAIFEQVFDNGGRK